MTDGRTWAVTGAEGMLGQDVQHVLGNARVMALPRGILDITDQDAVLETLSGLKPGDVVVNCAAYTAVDDAESNEAMAFAVNALGPRNLAQACAATGAHLVQISTDYVFSGKADQPYRADSATGPRSAYGRTKLAGEWAVQAVLPERHWTLRTAWLYGEHGASFVRTMINLEASREFVDVVEDQHGQPTWSRDLARRIVELVESKAPAGAYHACASGQTTWHGLATEVFRQLGADPARVRPTDSSSFVRPAPRPAFSVLDLRGWDAVGLKPMRHWRDALLEAMRTTEIARR